MIGLTKAMTSAHTYQEGTNLFAWVCTIIRNHWFSEKRRAWRLMFFDPTGADPDAPHFDLPAPDDPSMRAQVLDMMGELVNLPDEQAEAMVLIGLGDTYDEAAVKQQIAVGTVKSRVARGRKALRRALKEPPRDERKLIDAHSY